MVATGLCHSDIFFAANTVPTQYAGCSAVLGHEGAGEVLAVGSEVTAARKGDLVVLSYGFCGTCVLCATGKESYCQNFYGENLLGLPKDVFEAEGSGGDVVAKFFGQSSFAGVSVVNECSVVKVGGLGVTEGDLKYLAPLGCGLQTGAGAVWNAAKGVPSDVLLVTGLGGVGLGAIMAGKIAGCQAIIAVDRVKSRLDLAREVGATHTVDTTGMKNEDLATEIQKAVGSETRISIAVETTGVPALAFASIRALGMRGYFVQLGVSNAITDPNTTMSIPWNEWWGKKLVLDSNIEGSSTARVFVPLMIQWWKEGKFPMEKLVKTFKAQDSEQAIEAMESGRVVKPVFLW